MKEQLHEWEADIRRKVEQHEFDFEPQAWAEMEQLLKQQAPGGNSAGAKGLKGLWWKIGAAILSTLTTALIIFWLLPNDPAEDTPELSSFSIAYEEGEQKMDKEKPLPKKEPLIIINPIPAKELSAPTDSSYYPMPQGVEPLPDAPKEMKVLQSLPGVPPAPLPYTVEWDTEGYQLPKPKPKRDRRKLFPDIIERNK